MTDQQIADLGPAFSRYLARYRDCFLQQRTAGPSTIIVAACFPTCHARASNGRFPQKTAA
jgi:hypothetical protein